MNVELRGGVDCRERKHDHGVGYGSPLDTLPFAADGAKQRSHALEENYDEYP